MTDQITNMPVAEDGFYKDPFDDPDFDPWAWIMTINFLPEPLVVRRDEFIEWAGAAGFENIEMRYLDDDDYWEFRCRRGTTDECTSPAHVERWLGYIARGCCCRIAPGQFIAIVDGDSIAARFRLEPKEDGAA
jgi:hypothetical protein